MIFSTTVFFICCISTIHGQKLHEHMTKDEVQSVFNCQHDVMHEVEYQVVHIFHKSIDGNSGRRLRKAAPTIHLKAFDQNYTLYLENNSHVLLGNNTPVFIAKQSIARRSIGAESTIVYSRIRYPLPEDFKLYHDVEQRAAVTIHVDDEKKVHVDGTVGDDLIIRSLPLRVHKEVLNRYQSYSRTPFAERPFDPFGNMPFIDDPFVDDSYYYQPTHHVVIKPNNQTNSPFLGSISNQWNQIKHQWLNQNNEPINQFPNWNNIHGQPGNWHQEPVTWRPATREPFTWRPATIEPFTWRPATREPFTWRPATREPFTWRPATREPVTWRPTTKKPFTWRPTTKEPFTWRPVTSKPVTSHSTISPSTSSMPSIVKTDTVYPQLLITADYETYTTHGKDVETVAKYMAAFWNAVDLRFREISNPNIRLNIAGLIIPQQSSAASYMETHQVGNRAVLAEETLREVGKYFSKEKKFADNTYDIVVAMSHRNLGAIDKSGKFSDSITGIATFEGACRTKYGQSVALVRDKGGFNGITTAAHELAHALGAPHDGPESAHITGGPCPWNDGYLMSYERKTSRGMHWSQCSITAMKSFFKKPQAQCLKNKPDAGTPYPKILPGKILSRDEQCQRSMGLVSYKDKENDCAVLWCAKYMGRQIQYRTEYRPPAEGSYCGKGAICLNAKCVKDPNEN